MLNRIKETADFLKKLMPSKPDTAIILGSGLGGLVNEITDKTAISYADIPNFPVSTVEGHSGQLIFGKLGKKDILAMNGRFHYYEGYSLQETTFPIRVMRELGIKTLFVSNASGGTNPDFQIGDLMIITDQINMLPNPLIGQNLEDFGPRFPDMTRPYDPKLVRMAEEIASEKGIKVRKGTYLAVTGPCYETPAEYGFYRSVGADAVGMSTTPEVIVARHSSVPCFGMSVITDVAHSTDDEDYVTDGEEIVKAADAAADRMTLLFTELISRI